MREALEPVIGELVVDKMHTYLSELVVEDLLLRSQDGNTWHRYLALEAVMNLMHRTDSRHTSLKKEYSHLRKKHKARLTTQRKQILQQFQ